MRAIPSLDMFLVPWSVLLRAILASLFGGGTKSRHAAAFSR
jgi:hypothetical protein